MYMQKANRKFITTFKEYETTWKCIESRQMWNINYRK